MSASSPAAANTQPRKTGPNEPKIGEVGYLQSSRDRWDPVDVSSKECEFPNSLPSLPLTSHTRLDGVAVLNLCTRRFWVYDEVWVTIHHEGGRCSLAPYKSQTLSQKIDWAEIDQGTLKPFFRDRIVNKSPKLRKDEVKTLVFRLWMAHPTLAAVLDLSQFAKEYEPFPAASIHAVQPTTWTRIKQGRKKSGQSKTAETAIDDDNSSVITTDTKRTMAASPSTPSKKRRSSTKQTIPSPTEGEESKPTATTGAFLGYVLATSPTGNSPQLEAVADGINEQFGFKPGKAVQEEVKKDISDWVLHDHSGKDYTHFLHLSMSFVSWLDGEKQKGGRGALAGAIGDGGPLGVGGNGGALTGPATAGGNLAGTAAAAVMTASAEAVWRLR